jgi:hypothetical protein
MRRLIAAAAVLAGALVPASAAAQEVPACRLDSAGSYAYQARLAPLLSQGGTASAREATGAQFTALWLLRRDEGWHIGLAPGPLTPEAAHAAIVERLRARFGAEDVAYLAEHLHVDPQPYPEAELRRIQEEVGQRFIAARWAVGWTLGVACRASDGYRVEAELFNDRTPEVEAQARAILAPYGDRVRLVLHDTPPAIPLPLPSPAPRTPGPAPHVGHFLVLPRPARCVHGRVIRLHVRLARRERVRSVTVRAAGRRIVARNAALRRPIVVRLGRSRTKVAIAVDLRDGRTSLGTPTFRRCR